MTDSSRAAKVGPNDILRFVLEVVAIATLGIWGFVAWPFPLNIVIGIGAPLVAVVLWGLFRSPEAVFKIDVYGKTIIEVLVMGAAAFAWWNLGGPIVAVVFGAVAVVSGLINGRKEFSS